MPQCQEKLMAVNLFNNSEKSVCMIFKYSSNYEIIITIYLGNEASNSVIEHIFLAYILDFDDIICRNKSYNKFICILRNLVISVQIFLKSFNNYCLNF